jgi:transcriptional regulator
MKIVPSSMKRGSAELAILSVLLEEPLHGYEISKRIEEHTGGVLRFNLASLYPMLYRLEKRSWVKASWQTTSSGRKRRCYTLTAAGRKQLPPLRDEWRLFFRALDRLAGVSRA